MTRSGVDTPARKVHTANMTQTKGHTMTTTATPSIKRDGSVDLGIFRIGSVKREWPLHMPSEVYVARTPAGDTVTMKLRRADAVAQLVTWWGNVGDSSSQGWTREYEDCPNPGCDQSVAAHEDTCPYCGTAI